MSARRGSREDRPVAKRARAPLHAALEPADDVTVGDRRGGAAAERVVVVDALDRATLPPRNPLRRAASSCRNRVVVELRTPVGVVHRRAACAAELVPDGTGGADRAAGVARRRLHVDLAEGRHLRHLCRWRPSSSAQPPAIASASSRVTRMQRFEQVKERFLVHRLHRARDVHVALLERLVRPARRTQQRLELRRVRAPRRPAIRSPIRSRSSRGDAGSSRGLGESRRLPPAPRSAALRRGSAGSPYGASPITLYSSPYAGKPRNWVSAW